MEHKTAGMASKEDSGASDSTQLSKIAENSDVEVLSISTTPEVRPKLPSVIPASECRRSSRKKIIKFDVRDLLNKNRKPHKIQIEARIDSNVPNTSKACSSITRGDPSSTASGIAVVGSQDLSSKQKAFMEKSAIFRRFSISQDQSKPPPPPPIPLPPTMLSKVGDKKDVIGSMNLTGKRLNRSQEYYNNALLKPKQTTSLIVAQVESNVRSVELKSQVYHKPTGDGLRQSDVCNSEQPQQKKRGRPPKIRSTEPGKRSPTIGNKEMEKSKLSPEKAKNWKEYKACLAEQYTKKNENLSGPKGKTTSGPNEESSSFNTLVCAKEEDLDSSEKNSSANELTLAPESFPGINKQVICTEVTSIVKGTTETLSDRNITNSLEQSFPSGETAATPREIYASKGINKSFSKDESEETTLEEKDVNKTHQEIKRSTCDIEHFQEIKDLKLVEAESISKKNILCGENNVIRDKQADGIPTKTLIEDKSLSLRRDSFTSENSCNTSLSSITTPSTSTHKTESCLESWSEVSTLKEKNSSSSPDEGRNTLQETKRSKRLQKKATNTNRKNIDVCFPAIVNNREGHSRPFHDSENSLHENTIITENEKSCDASVENTSSDSLSATDVIEFKDSQLKEKTFLEESYSNDPPKSSTSSPKGNVYTQQRKSLRKRKEYSKQCVENLQQTKIDQKVQKNNNTDDITQNEVTKDEATQQDNECLDVEEQDSKEQERVHKANLELPNTTHEVLAYASPRIEETNVKTQTIKDHTENEKKDNMYTTADEKVPYVKRKSPRNQRDDTASSSLESFDESENQSEPLNIKNESNIPPKEENTQLMEECFSDTKGSVDKLTHFKGKYQKNTKDYTASSIEATRGLIDPNVELKEDQTTKLEIPTLTVRKSLRKQKDIDIPSCPESVKGDKPSETFKTNENLVLHIIPDADSQQAKSDIQIEGKSTNIAKSVSTQRMSLRKDEDKPSPRNVHQDEFKSVKNIFATTLTDANSPQAEKSTTIFNDLECAAEKEVDLLASTKDDLLSTEEHKKSSKYPTSVQRMSLRNHKDESVIFPGNPQSVCISENLQNSTEKVVDATISNILSPEKHQICDGNPTFTQKGSQKDKKHEREPSPERNIITSIVDNSQNAKESILKKVNLQYEAGKDADVPNWNVTYKNPTEVHQTCISKTSSAQELSSRNTEDAGVSYTPENNIVATNEDNSQQAEQLGITSENSQPGIDVEGHQTCVDALKNCLNVLKEDKVSYNAENLFDEKSSEMSNTENDGALSSRTIDNYPLAVQSKSITDNSKSVTRKSIRKQKYDNVSYAQNINSTDSKEVGEGFVTKGSLDTVNINESTNGKEEMDDVPSTSSVKDVDIKELSNNGNDPTVYTPTTKIFQTLHEDSNVTNQSAVKPKINKNIVLTDQKDKIAPFLIECEDIQNLSAPPKIVTTVSIQESQQLSENDHVPTISMDKQNLPKRTSLRKQKETIVLPSDDKFDHKNNEKGLIYPTEDQSRKTTKRSTFGHENDSSSSSSSLENVKNENEIKFSKREYMMVTTKPTDVTSQTGIKTRTIDDVTVCKGEKIKLIQVEPETNIVSKDLEFISLENIENVKLNKTSDKDETRKIGARTPESKCSQPPDDAFHAKRKRTRKSRFQNVHVPNSETENTLGSGDTQIPVTVLSNLEETVKMDLPISSKDTTMQIKPESRDENKLEIISQTKEVLTVSSPSQTNKIEINKAILETSNEQTASSQFSTDYPNKKKIDVAECRSNESSQSIDSPSTPQTESTNAYVIKNLSIETNTLLDILRTVQSNEEAAVEAKKACDSVAEMQDSEVAPNTKMTKNVMSQKKLIDTNSSSPCRSDSASPLTLKNVPSPCRSDTSSPLALKKCNSSPSRSDTSSPLSLNKKITRRYERRSRRGDDSTHKTLEETFAEIAALSSKAVLEMSAKGDDIIEINAAEENNSNVINDGTALVEKSARSFNTQDDIAESEIKECTQKLNQPITGSANVDVAGSTCCSQEPESDKYEPCIQVIKPPHNALVTYVDPEKSENNKINVEPNIFDGIKAAHQDVTIKFEPENNNTNALMLRKDFHQESTQDDKQLDKPNDKNDYPTQQTKEQISETSSEEICAAKIREDECLTPKSSPKKRDSVITKSANKKSHKNSKTPENIELSKLDDITSKPTTPPPKRGRKAKATMQIDSLLSPANSSGGKKNIKKEQREEEAISEPKNDVATETEIFSDKSIDEKVAKKKRQRKLKEAFEAALNEHPVEFTDTTFETPASSPTFDINLKSSAHLLPDIEQTNCKNTTGSVSQVSAVEPEEDPDPLKDIEKFIEDGVNLLKKAYKIDEDSVDNIIIGNTNVDECDITTTVQEDGGSSNKEIFTGNFETPADTPIATPSVTPPPKSPESSSLSEEHGSGGVRRSHRIKLITKTPKALVGRGLVRDKERFSIKDDVETKSHYTLDDHLLDLAEVEAKNAKFLKEMEERLSNFHVIKENEYKCERVISKEARKMICDCFLTAEEEGRGELACGEDCLNRLLMIECGPECNIRERCTNKRFQKLLCSPCRVFRTEKKGFGILADIEILPGEFIMEYVGEVIDTDEFERRRIAYSQDKNRHYYFMALRSDAIIDATIKGNISRFINHSCDPNAETQKWTVNGELRIGFFSRKSIMPGEEITFNYQYQRYGREAQRCYCESANCRGWIGQEPTSDEGEQIDDDDYESDEEDEEEDNSNLLEEDDDDSDASVSDPEEVQKKLELAAAQAAAELAPITLDEKPNHVEDNCKEKEEDTRPETEEEDSKSKFKKLLSKMAEKVAAKHKQTKREQKLQRKKKSKESSSELANKQRYLEDPDIEDEVEFLSRCGLKNQSDTLRLSRLMVRAKLVQTRLNLLDILRKGELPCRRLFLDYHGLRLVHGWMSEDAGNMQIRLALLLTLELLPIANKTMLTDSKVMQVVRSWCGSKEALSPNEDSLSSNSNSQDGSVQPSGSSKSSIDDSTSSECGQLQKLALKLVSTWDGLPEIFRIPKKERIEQMKEHEREADRQYAETEGNRHSSTDIDKTNRFGKRATTKRFGKPNCSKQLQTTGNTMRSGNMTPENLNYISKAQRREMFAAKVARDEAEKRMAEERREFETKCRFFGLDPKKTRPQDVPFCVNPATGQWYSVERKPISTPPSYAHVQVPEKHKSTNPVDYQLPAVCATLPPQWKYVITPLGQIYYYHVQYRVPQWEPPTSSQLQDCEINIEEVDSGNEHTPTTGPDSSDDDDDILVGMDGAQLKAYIDRKVEARRQKRYQRLVDERAISPRREEDRVYNQLEVRKYKENKEKIRKRKEEIRRKRADALRQSSHNMCTLGSLTELNPSQVKGSEIEDDGVGILPIQDYLLSSDEDDDIKIEVNSPLIDKIVEGDKIVDELDALTTKRPLKRTLPPHREINEPSTSSSASALSSLAAIDRQDYKKRKLEKKDKRKPKEQDAKYRKTKEKFRCEIAGIIVHHLKSYRKDTCSRGRIQSNDDFNHLARKLTHFVMIKELKYCESVGQTLVVTESVKNKSREFIKKYMTKYGDLYVKPSNDPEFKDIPFTL